MEPLKVSFVPTISVTELACFHAKGSFSGARMAVTEADVLISSYVYFIFNGQTQRGRLGARKSKKTHFDPNRIKQLLCKVLDTPKIKPDP